MYFNLITPKKYLEREAAIQWSRGPYEQHQWLWQFFPAQPETQRDFLFRRIDGDNKTPGFYVVSSRKPEPTCESWQIQSREYNPSLSAGQRLAFDLRANPVVTHKINGKSRRDDIVMQEKKRLLLERGLKRWSDWRDDDSTKPSLYELVQSVCSAWLEKRAELAGFRLLTNNVSKSVRVDSYLQHSAGKKEIRFSTVDFSGELEVIDPALFKKALFNGIGKAKAFGCGLLLVKKL